MQTTELAAWLRLLLTPQIGSATARKLLAALGSPETVFKQSPSALTVLVGTSKAQALSCPPDDLTAQIQATVHWLDHPLAGSRNRFITLGDALYPPSLLQIADPPLILYAQFGEHLCTQPDTHLASAMCGQSLAIVGSRNPTPQGLVNAKAFSSELAASGWCIVSGMALGIDGAAHEGALAARTAPERIASIAVVGTGLDRVYPRKHHALAHELAQQAVVLSEYPLGTAPLAPNFPKRNRLISGLSRGVLVVEAALQSGSLITAQTAIDQGKEVFAIPGSIHSTQSHGCHALIKQGAKLVESARDILEELGDASLPLPLRSQLQEADDESSAARVPQHLRSTLQALGFDPTHFDALQARVGTQTAELQAHLLELELSGLVSRLPGGLFQRLDRA